MRRQIDLYIDGHRADLDQDALVQLTFKATDYTNPAAVRISFSQQITLPGTATNAAIFGYMWRGDRVTTPGSFDVLQRTPFTLYDDKGAVVETGYCKLDKVTRKGKAVSYSVTLYGGLGSFLYALTYDGMGEKRTLASLDWMGTKTPESEFDFTINRQAVEDAWQALKNGTAGMWQAVNFAPCYNGKPSDFESKQIVADVAACNAQYPGTFSPTYNGASPLNGCVLVTSEREWTEWAMCDLRSYLQRPAYSIKAFFAALIRDAAANGYDLQLDSAFFDDSNPYYADTWVTLPMLSLHNKSQGAGISVSLAGGPLSASGSYTATFSPAIAPGKKTTVNIPILLSQTVDLGGAAEAKWSYNMNYTTPRHQCAALKAIAFDSSNNIVAEGMTQYVAPDPVTLDWLLSVNAPGTDGVIAPEICRADFQRYGLTNNYICSNVPTLSVQGYGIDHVAVQVTRFCIDINSWEGYNTMSLQPAGSFFAAKGAVPYTAPLSATLAAGSSVLYEEATVVRSGMTITKADLLGGTPTPAEVLLSYCKTFGLHLYKDKETQKVSILRRDTFYNGGTEDLEDLVDMSTAHGINPTAAPTKWLRLTASVNGGLAEDYKNRYAQDYGAKRIDTGYDFDADVTDLLKDYKLKGAADWLQESEDFGTPGFVGAYTGKNYNWKTVLHKAVYGTGSDAQTTPDVVWLSSTRTAWGAALNLDTWQRPQFCKDDGSAVDGDGVLVFLNKTTRASYDTAEARYRITDDTATMLALTGGKCCWLLTEDNGSRTVSEAIFPTYIPQFGRVLLGPDVNTAVLLLDFGTPREVYVRTLKSIPADIDIYSQYWRAYMRDRYDRDTKAITCKVKLYGKTVDGSLLRKFYAFDGAIWSLSSIKNYCAQVATPVECEFIKVKDTAAYGVSEPVKHMLSVSPASYLSGALSNAFTITVESTDAWTLTAPAWMTPSVVSGGTDGVHTITAVTVTLAANTDADPRTGSLSVTSSSGLTGSTSVEQSGVGGGTVYVDSLLCIGCGNCVPVCPAAAISIDEQGVAVINYLACTECGACVGVCPVGAIHH